MYNWVVSCLWDTYPCLHSSGSQLLTAEYVEASPCVDLPVFGLLLPTQEGALHAHHAEHEAQRAHRQRPH